MVPPRSMICSVSSARRGSGHVSWACDRCSATTKRINRPFACSLPNRSVRAPANRLTSCAPSASPPTASNAVWKSSARKAAKPSIGLAAAAERPCSPPRSSAMPKSGSTAGSHAVRSSTSWASSPRRSAKPSTRDDGSNRVTPSRRNRRLGVVSPVPAFLDHAAAHPSAPFPRLNPEKAPGVRRPLGGAS